MPESEGNKYLVTMIDRATKYPVAVPIKKQDFDSVWNAFHNNWLGMCQGHCTGTEEASSRRSSGQAVPTVQHRTQRHPSLPSTDQWDGRALTLDPKGSVEDHEQHGGLGTEAPTPPVGAHIQTYSRRRPLLASSYL